LQDIRRASLLCIEGKCAPFGEYAPDPLSLFLEKRLLSRARLASRELWK
jgi:hypothetical protein